MYNEIIEKLTPYKEKLIDDLFSEMVFAYNLHSYAIEEYGAFDANDTSAFIFDSSKRNDIKNAIDKMEVESFYNMVKRAEKTNFYFNVKGEILTHKEVSELLNKNFQYFLYETIAKPWESEETKGIYDKLFKILVCNNVSMYK